MNAMVALERCRRAWERTSPQLVIDGWLDMLDALDEPQEIADCTRLSLRFVEPVRPPHSPADGPTSRLAAGVNGKTCVSSQVARLRVPPGPEASTQTPAASRVLTAGAEPCCGTPDGLAAIRPAADAPVAAGASAPLQHDGPCRISPEEQRGGGQEGV